jgi:hypothetical protein
MLVRVRFRHGRPVSRKQGKNRHLALAFAALLWPAILTAYVLGFWRLGADLRITGGFGIAQGVFSHWQVWLGLAAVLNIAAIVLNRYGRDGEMKLPGSLFAWISSFGHRAGER